MIIRKGFFRRFEVWLILTAVVVSLTLSCSGCTRADPNAPPPPPSRVIARYNIPQSRDDGWVYGVVEFRASNGNICVYVDTAYSGVMDCSPPLPPLDYKDLPHVEGEQP